MRTADFPAGSVAATAAVCERPPLHFARLRATAKPCSAYRGKTKPRLAPSTLSSAPRLLPSCAVSHVSTMLQCVENARPTPHPPILIPHLLRNGKVHDQHRNCHDAASRNWLHAAYSTCHALISEVSPSLASACAMQRSKRSMTSGLPRTLQANHRNPPTASASWPTAAA